MATNIILVHCRFMVGVIRNDFPWPIRVQTFISPAHLANHCTSCKKEIGGNQAASADWCLQDLLDHVRHCDFRVLLKHTGHQAIAAYVINALPSITRGGSERKREERERERESRERDKIYLDALHLNRSGQVCAYQHFASSNHLRLATSENNEALNNQDVAREGTYLRQKNNC